MRLKDIRTKEQLCNEVIFKIDEPIFEMLKKPFREIFWTHFDFFLRHRLWNQIEQNRISVQISGE